MEPLNISFPLVGRNSLDLFRGTGGVPDAKMQRYHIFRKDLPSLLLVVSAICAFGAWLQTILKQARIPVLIIICFVGIVLGISSRYIHKLQSVNAVANVDPVLFLHMFTPVIIFKAAFDMDFYIFRKSFWQVLVLAIPGFLMSCAFIGGLVYKINTYGWTWETSILFGVILSTTDPILSVATIKNIGLSKIVINIIKAESLCSDVTTSILFAVYRDFVYGVQQEISREVFIKLILKFFGSVIFGFLSSRVVMFWLKHVVRDSTVEVIVSFAMTYIIFFLAEWFGMSGVISVGILALLLDTVSFSPGTDLFLYKFWSMTTFLTHVMIYFITGVMLSQKTFVPINLRFLFYALTIYLSINLTRAFVIFALSPFLSRLGYGFNWRWGAVIAWSGMRGIFTLNMAFVIARDEGVDKQHWKNMILLHTGTASLLTLMVNATTLKKLVMALGLCDITLPKRIAMHNAVHHIGQMEAKRFELLKFDRHLADAHWTMAEETFRIDNPFELSAEEESQIFGKLKCPDCCHDVSFERSSQQIADIMEEARLRLLNAEIAIYKKQYNMGILNQEAAQTLISAAENYIDMPGKFMNIQEVKAYWESKGLLVTVKNWLSSWYYNVKEEKYKPSRNKILKMCHHIVFTDEFESTSTVITLLNFPPILFHFIPQISSEFPEQLKLCNYYFLSLYIIEAILKISAMQRTYLYHHWNQFELLIVIVGIIDVIVMNVLKKINLPYYMLKIINVFRIFRLLRILRVLKIVIPKVIPILDKKINKQLSFRYEVAKGYVQGEEYISCLIEQITGHKSIQEEFEKIFDKNKQETVKALGLMQHEYPEIVIAMKTKQAVQRVLNTAFETLNFMVSRGIVNRYEGIELCQMILLKKKKVAMLPRIIAPPAPEDLLRSVIWLQDTKECFNFIQQRGRIIYYDDGDVICTEGELPHGIHLIISGMAKLHGSAPRYGVQKELYEQRHPRKLPYTDYLVIGAIIGELNCITKQEMEYMVTCETSMQTYFISTEDLFEGFDKFSEDPGLEDKMWLKLALDVGLRTLKENFPFQDWTSKICGQFSKLTVVDVPDHTKKDIYDETMEYVILVHGTVHDCQLPQLFCAPLILPRTCHQVQGAAAISKLLVISATETEKRKDYGTYGSICETHADFQRQGTVGSIPSIRSTDTTYTYQGSAKPSTSSDE